MIFSGIGDNFSGNISITSPTVLQDVVGAWISVIFPIVSNWSGGLFPYSLILLYKLWWYFFLILRSDHLGSIVLPCTHWVFKFLALVLVLSQVVLWLGRGFLLFPERHWVQCYCLLHDK